MEKRPFENEVTGIIRCRSQSWRCTNISEDNAIDDGDDSGASSWEAMLAIGFIVIDSAVEKQWNNNTELWQWPQELYQSYPTE